MEHGIGSENLISKPGTKVSCEKIYTSKIIYAVGLLQYCSYRWLWLRNFEV